MTVGQVFLQIYDMRTYSLVLHPYSVADHSPSGQHTLIAIQEIKAW
jgi:hypothetical protein